MYPFVVLHSNHEIYFLNLRIKYFSIIISGNFNNLSIFFLKLLVQVGFKSMLQILVEGKMFGVS